MKKFYLIAALALASLTASAQTTLNLSTYAGTDLTKLDGQTKTVTVNRYLFKGWNTISLPFAMTAAEVNAAFGSDCRLETLVGVENTGSEIKLNFQDVKANGIEANKPYILYFNNESKSVKFVSENAKLHNASASVSFTDNTGVTVKFSAAKTKLAAKGLYGILARDNAEAAFVNVDDVNNGFYATRCYIELSSGNSQLLKANHIAEGDVTAIGSVVKANEHVDVYNVSGAKVASKASISDINGLNKGIYVVKGKKIAVK